MKWKRETNLLLKNTRGSTQLKAPKNRRIELWCQSSHLCWKSPQTSTTGMNITTWTRTIYLIANFSKVKRIYSLHFILLSSVSCWALCRAEDEWDNVSIRLEYSQWHSKLSINCSVGSTLLMKLTCTSQFLKFSLTAFIDSPEINSSTLSH